VAREHIITALDIGSTTVRVATALVDSKQAVLRLVGAGEEPTLGVRRGQIVDIPEVVTSVSKAFSEVERVSGFSLSKTFVTVSGPQVDLLRSIGSIAVSRADGEVSPEDVARVLESARTVSLPQNKEVIHTLPISFLLDGDVGLQDPVGMKGVRLEANVILVLASSPLLRTVNKVVAEAERQSEGWLFGPRVAGRAVLTKKQREAGVALLDIGGTSTDIALFKDGELAEHRVVPLGGSHITHDVAIGLKTPIDVAERVKVEYGSAFSSAVSKREKVVLTDWGLEDITVSRYALSKIIETRARKLFSEIGKKIEDYTEYNMLPGGAVLVGGAAKLDGMVECAKRELKLPVASGVIRDLEGTLPELTDPAYSSVCGALLNVYEAENMPQNEASRSTFEIQGAIEKVKDWLKDFLP